MNSAFTTNLIVPLTIGSLETFQETATLNGSPWNLTGGTANLILEDPAGNKTTLAATIASNPNNQASVNWTVTGPPGLWTRTWSFQDASGNKQISLSKTFLVTQAPP